MSHAERCPVCNGHGSYGGITDSGGAEIEQYVCHGCDGKGWVEVGARERDSDMVTLTPWDGRDAAHHMASVLTSGAVDITGPSDSPAQGRVVNRDDGVTCRIEPSANTLPGSDWIIWPADGSKGPLVYDDAALLRFKPLNAAAESMMRTASERITQESVDHDSDSDTT